MAEGQTDEGGYVDCTGCFPVQRPLIRPCGAPSPLWGEGHACGTDANQYTFKDGRDVQRPFLFPCRKKKRFLGSKEKGAFEIWGAVRCSAAAPIFTSPLCTGPGRYGLCGRNREKRMFYLSAAWAVGIAA